MKASKCNYFHHLWMIGALIVAAIFVPFLIELFIGNKLHTNALNFLEAMLVFPCIIAMILFGRYYTLSRSIEVKYLNDEIIINDKGDEKIVQLNDIQIVKFIYPIPVYFRGFRYFPTDSFMYALIKLKTGERLVITSFLDLELFYTQRFFESKVRVEKKATLICWPPTVPPYSDVLG